MKESITNVAGMQWGWALQRYSGLGTEHCMGYSVFGHSRNFLRLRTDSLRLGTAGPLLLL